MKFKWSIKMLKSNYLKIFPILILICLMFQSLMFAQETVEQRRAREHQVVIDYLNYKLSTYPINTNPYRLFFG